MKIAAIVTAVGASIVSAATAAPADQGGLWFVGYKTEFFVANGTAAANANVCDSKKPFRATWRVYALPGEMRPPPIACQAGTDQLAGQSSRLTHFDSATNAPIAVAGPDEVLVVYRHGSKTGPVTWVEQMAALGTVAAPADATLPVRCTSKSLRMKSKSGEKFTMQGDEEVANNGYRTIICGKNLPK